MSSLVNDYFELSDVESMISMDNKHDPDECRYPIPGRKACVRFACDQVGTFECDDQDEIAAMMKACRGNFGDACLRKSVSYLHKFEYDDTEEMTQLARSCKGLFEVDCIEYVCDKLGTFGCDDLEEIVQVNRQCAGM